MTDSIQCPKCGHANPLSAYFCINCHAILIRRCPNCWHEQRQGLNCEKCGTNFALAAELAFEKSQQEEALIERDKAVGEALTFLQVVSLPFTSFAGVVRGLLLRVVTGLLSR